MKHPKAAPVKPKNRIEQIDVLRGFALFGVLLVNLFGYNASFFDFSGFYSQFKDPLNSTVYNLVVNYGSDKFIGLFSLLFGIGFSIMYTKYAHQESRFVQLYFRRLIILMGFGIIHIVLFWAGDILLSYSILGLVLLLMRKLNTRLLLILSTLFYFLPIFYISLNVMLPWLPNALSSTSELSAEAIKETYSAGSFIEIFKLRMQEYYAFRYINVFYYAPKILALFIAGYVFHRKNLFEKINHSRIHYFIFGMLSLFIGILLNTYTLNIVDSIADANSNAYYTALYMGVFEVTNVFLIASYLLLVLTISTTSVFRKILKPLKNIGRMSLTNYLTYSVLFTTIMYSYGFGLFGSLNPVELVLVSVLFFTFQIIYCTILLKYHQYGPLEWVWRKLMYRNL
ncbi:MAG: DUF418 domain-containing protein [Salinivirgaceae bacterium]|jgi:uncharacterized protein|nr:DUF418 domain-containing protein [Salinivirgaceae bacterium]